MDDKKCEKTEIKRWVVAEGFVPTIDSVFQISRVSFGLSTRGILRQHSTLCGRAVGVEPQGQAGPGHGRGEGEHKGGGVGRVLAPERRPRPAAGGVAADSRKNEG